MKTLTLLGSLLLLSAAMFAQTTYNANSRSTVHPYPVYSATLELGDDPYTEFALVRLGSGWSQVLYSLPDGTSADLGNLSLVSFTQDPNNPQVFTFVGKADGVDSLGEKVSVSATWTYLKFTRAGRGGGTMLLFMSGSLTVSK